MSEYLFWISLLICVLFLFVSTSNRPPTGSVCFPEFSTRSRSFQCCKCWCSRSCSSSCSTVSSISTVSTVSTVSTWGRFPSFPHEKSRRSSHVPLASCCTTMRFKLMLIYLLIIFVVEFLFLVIIIIIIIFTASHIHSGPARYISELWSSGEWRLRSQRHSSYPWSRAFGVTSSCWWFLRCRPRCWPAVPNGWLDETQSPRSGNYFLFLDLHILNSGVKFRISFFSYYRHQVRLMVSFGSTFFFFAIHSWFM